MEWGLNEGTEKRKEQEKWDDTKRRNDRHLHIYSRSRQVTIQDDQKVLSYEIHNHGEVYCMLPGYNLPA